MSPLSRYGLGIGPQSGNAIRSVQLPFPLLDLRGSIGENGAPSSVSFWIRVQERAGTAVVIFRLGGKDVDWGRSDPEL